MVVSGDNFQGGKIPTGDSYYFSRYPHCWEWATWKRAWQYYDRDMKLWPEIRDNHYLNSILDSPRTLQYWTNIFQNTYTDRNNSWAYRWTFSCWIQNVLTIIPARHLVSNIGFIAEATHTSTTENLLANLPVDTLDFPLHYPLFAIRNFDTDDRTQNKVFQSSFFDIIKRRLRKLIGL
jgi:hypothetical protein